MLYYLGSFEDCSLLFLHYSSVSSMLNSLAAVTWEDFLKLKFGYLSESNATIVTRVLGNCLQVDDL